MYDLIQLLESVLGSGHSEGKNYRFKCPFPECLGASRSNLSIVIDTSSEGKNPWMCWNCNHRGQTIKSLFFHVAPDKISRLNTIIVPQYSTPSTSVKEQVILQLPEEFRPLYMSGIIASSSLVYRQAASYLKSRNFTDDDMAKYNLGYCEDGRYRNRIIFPSYDRTGQLNYFVGRTWIEDAEPKYLPCDAPRKDIVPFELFINWKVPVILCEGFFDAKAIARNVIPLMEKDITPGIMNKLLQSEVKKIYIVLDKDAIKHALRHAEFLIGNGKKVYLVELEDKDPSKMGFEAFTTMIHTAKATTREDIMLKKMKMSLYE